MEWTKDRPTKGGLFFAADEFRSINAIDVYMLCNGSGNRLVAFELGDDYDKLHELSEYLFFYGPVEPPELPNIEVT